MEWVRTGIIMTLIRNQRINQTFHWWMDSFNNNGQKGGIINDDEHVGTGIDVIDRFD
jgi:hypothetical protein